MTTMRTNVWIAGCAVTVMFMTADVTRAQTSNRNTRQPSIQRRVSIPRSQERTPSRRQQQTNMRLRNNWHAHQVRVRQAAQTTQGNEQVRSSNTRVVHDPQRLFGPPTLPFLRPDPNTGYVTFEGPQRDSTLRPGQFDQLQAQRLIGSQNPNNPSNRSAEDRIGRSANSLAIGQTRSDGSVDYFNVRRQNYLFGFRSGETGQDLLNSRTGQTAFGFENTDGTVDYLNPFTGQWSYSAPSRDRR